VFVVSYRRLAIVKELNGDVETPAEPEVDDKSLQHVARDVQKGRVRSFRGTAALKYFVVTGLLFTFRESRNKIETIVPEWRSVSDGFSNAAELHH